MQAINQIYLGTVSGVDTEPVVDDGTEMLRDEEENNSIEIMR